MAAPNKSDRLAAGEIPAWIPEAVASAPMEMPHSDVLMRLLTDERMKSLWRALSSRQTVNESAVANYLLCVDFLQTWVGDRSFTPQQRAMAAFLSTVVVACRASGTLGGNRVIGSNKCY